MNRPHVGGPILPPGHPTTIIGGLPPARIGDMLTCTPPVDEAREEDYRETREELLAGPPTDMPDDEQ